VGKLYVLFDSPPKQETLVLGEALSRPSEKASPKREFAECHCNALAQAREPSLSETGLIALAKASSLSEHSVVLCFKARRFAQEKSLGSA